jgi:acetolactate synthase-1/2/3 large subunit
MRHRRLGTLRAGARGRAACRCREPPIDEDAIKAAAKRLGAAKRPLIVAGGGAQDASAEVTLLAQLLQAPVLSYRRGRGVIDDRDPLSRQPAARPRIVGGGRRGARGRHPPAHPLLQWGIDRDLAIVRVDADPDEPAASPSPKVALIGDAAPILRRLIDVLPAHNARGPRAADEMRSAMRAHGQAPGQARAAARLSSRRSAPNCPRTASSSTR